ncbi:MAG: hypothetical protein Q8L48_24375 [Archangium sp.]|nr:hypothetical protein [Archangium sp.]
MSAGHTGRLTRGLRERHFEVMFNAGINRVRVTVFELTARALSRTSRAQRTR